MSGVCLPPGPEAPPTVDVVTAPRRRRVHSRRRLIGGGLALVLGAGMVLNLGLLRRAAAEMGRLSVGSVALVVAATVVYRLLQTALLAGSIEDLRWRRAALVSEAYTGCSNSLVGGGAVGTGVKAAMLRSWGVDGPAIAASITITAVVPALAMWAVALGQTLPRVMSGDADGTVTVVAVAASTALALHAVGWSAMLVRPGPSRRAAEIAGRGLHRAARWCRGPLRSAGPRLGAIDTVGVAQQMRCHAQRLVGARAGRLLAIGVASQLSLAAVLLFALHGVGGGAASTSEVLLAFAVARVTASLLPVPGGLGLLDVTLFTGLVHAGAPGSAVLAALVIFRACTYALPVLSGSVALLWWKRPALEPAAPATTTTPGAVPVAAITAAPAPAPAPPLAPVVVSKVAPKVAPSDVVVARPLAIPVAGGRRVRRFGRPEPVAA